MRRDSLYWLAAFCLAGCSTPLPGRVYVNLDQVVADSKATPLAIQIPKPPPPMPSKSYNLPGIPARVLENSASAEVLKPQADAAEAQAKAMKSIQERLRQVYAKQVDLFAAQQQELLADPDSKRVQEALPKLHEAFLKYADARLPLISRLTFLTGIPDSNPKSEPPPSTMRPVQKQRWLEANSIRPKVQALDSDYSNLATAILAEATALAEGDREAIRKKVEEYRKQMMDRAMEEAMDSLRSRKRPAILRLEAAPEIILPNQPPQSVNIPATPALTAAPQVEFERPGESEKISRELLLRQLDIWSGINQYTVVRQPGSNLRDATKDFETWRNQQKVGP